MSEESFYRSGFGGVKEEENRRDSMYGPARFWLRTGDGAEVSFVDDEPACIHEHSPKINGNWMNFTCLKDVYPDDPVCCEKLGFDTRAYVGFLTVCDFREWTDKKGVTHRFELKLLAAKLGSLKLLGGKKADRENRLSNRVYKVKRIGEKAPNIGDDWEYSREVDPAKADKFLESVTFRGKKLIDLYKSEKEEEIAKLRKTFRVATADGQIVPKVVPFNYLEVLKPKTPKELRDILTGARIEKNGNAKSGSSGSGGNGEGGKEDDVPF